MRAALLRFVALLSQPHLAIPQDNAGIWANVAAFAPCKCHFCLQKSATGPSRCSFAVILIGRLPDRAHTRLSIAGVGAVMDERAVLALLRAQRALLGS